MSDNRMRDYRAAERMLVYPDNIQGIEFLLSRRTATTLLEIIHGSLSCNSEEDFVSLFRKIQNIFPFDFAFTGLTKLDDDGRICSHNIINISYPDEWLKIYEEREFQNVDVIVKENFATFRPQYWAETYKRNTPPKHFISMAEDFGLKEGYTYGLMTPGQKRRGSLFSFSGNFDKYDKRLVAILESPDPPPASGPLPYPFPRITAERQGSAFRQGKGGPQLVEAGKKFLGNIGYPQHKRKDGQFPYL